MPTLSLKPVIQLSKSQFKEFLARTLAKANKVTPETAGKILEQEPPVTKEMGTLIRDMPIGGAASGESTRHIDRLPFEEARAKYLSDPGAYTSTRITEPSSKHLSVAEGPQELADRITYERLKFKPLTSKLSQVGGSTEGVTKEALPKAALEEASIKEAPLSEAVQSAMVAEKLWGDLGGGRSAAGKLWEEYRSQSKGATQVHIKTGRDYFISSFIRWKKDPISFQRNFPREGNLLNRIMKTIESASGGE